MPSFKRRRTDRKSNALTFRKKRRSTPKSQFSKMRMRLPLGGFPQRLTVRLKYVQIKTYDAAAGSFSMNSFRANSLHDPDATGVGHQPSNYDRLSEIYDRYTVIASQCKNYLVHTTNTNVTPGQVVCLLTEAGTDVSTAHASGGIENVLEQPRVARSIRNNGIVNAAGVNLRGVGQTFTAAKFFGVKNVVGENPYSTGVGTNPAEGAFFEVAYLSGDDTNDPGSVTIRTEIEYIAVMTEPKISDAS